MYRLFKKLAAGFLTLFLVSATYADPGSGALLNQSFAPKPLITPVHVQNIYQHIVEDHWVPETGLFLSFPSTGDHKLVQQASTYDQAAVGILALRLGDVERARGIFRFLRTAWLEGPLKGGREGVSGLANFYNADYSGAGIEKTIHMGPNAWAGLFAAYLGNVTGDKEATAWALEIARWIAQDLPHRDGAVAMGPLYGPDGIPWPKVFSTENNISYYAFLAELLRSNTLAPKDRALLTSEKQHVEDWLVNNAFDRLAYAMNRGMNPAGEDRTRALDSVTWLISAVGPERLERRGIDPDRLMRQAESSFAVKVHGLAGMDSTDQPEADLTFALNSEELVPHHGSQRPPEDKHRLIWYEGLGQYINALSVMAHYFQQRGLMEKARHTEEKAQHLAEQYDLAALKTVPDGAAYPYSTTGKFFHDGWYPPMDAPDGPAASLIASVWRCFAGLGFNPLSGQNIAGVPTVAVSVAGITVASHSRPSILYGTSEDMVVQAWQYLDQGDTDHAIQQAQATIQEWAPWAAKLQEKKARKVGRLVEYAGLPEQRKEVFSYWALNDVGAAYFILGKAFDLKGHYPQAAGAFQQIALRYPLAQIWDPHGWFWSPLESIRDDYVSRDPRHYSDVLPQMLAASSALGKQPN